MSLMCLKHKNKQDIARIFTMIYCFVFKFKTIINIIRDNVSEVNSDRTFYIDT